MPGAGCLDGITGHLVTRTAILGSLRGLLGLLGLLSGCALHPDTPPADEPPTEPADAQQLDLVYCSGGATWARRILLREQLDRSGIDTFTRLNDAQRRALERLSQRADQRLELLREGPRLLVTLPDGHPAGPGELLLADDLDQAVLYLSSPRRRISWPLEALPDLLDQSQVASSRDGLELDTAPIVEGEAERPDAPPPRPPGERLPGIGLRLHRRRGSVALQYFPEPGRSKGWSLRLQLDVLRVDDPTGGEPQPVAPLALALPLLAGDQGGHLLGALLDGGGTVETVGVTVANESKPARPVQLRIGLEPRDPVRVPLLRFCVERPGYREAPRRSVQGTGLVVAAAQELAALRASKPGGPLEVHNRSARAAWVYADGVLLGWVGAGKRLALRGLPEGFYRIYARSPSAVRAWGPFDVYVPGPLTLN